MLFSKGAFYNYIIHIFTLILLFYNLWLDEVFIGKPANVQTCL